MTLPWRAEFGKIAENKSPTQEGTKVLKLMIGKAGTGKTAAVINEIKQAVDSGQPGRLLLVPEQYSH